MFTSDFNENNNVLTCTFSGHLDTNSCITLHNDVSNAIQMTRKSSGGKELDDVEIRFDLKDVSYIASSFIRICVESSREMEHGRLVLNNCSPIVKKTFKIAGLDDLLEEY